MFKAAFARRRCLVPAGAFYEWRVEAGAKQPYSAARTDDEPMALAGLWEGWRNPVGEIIRTFTIVTTDANRTLADLHDRMPVIIESASWPVWLGEADGDLATLLRPAPDGIVKAWPVGKAVSNVRNGGPELLAAKE
jgi:putative SOS response-associated peptidase YedK